ncbi:MAG TPA: ABC transporter permease [Ktedonobacterales bacterium]|jgi:ABC-type nitrate/sulfonate/bicarbonate transport system permease component
MRIADQAPRPTRLATPVRARSAASAFWPPLAVLVALGVVWQLYAVRGVRDAQLLPPPTMVLAALGSQRGLLWHHTLVTLDETLVGFAAALVTGLALAALIDLSSWPRRALYPLLVASQTIPIITLAPLLVLWFGFGLVSKSIVVTLVCFFPIVVAAADGLRATDPELIKLYRAFGAGRLRIFWAVRVPGALPSVFSGVRIAITYSVIGAIFAEYVGATDGLGFYMEQQQHTFATQNVIAAIVVTALLSIALFAATVLLERLAVPWYYAQGRGADWRAGAGAGPGAGSRAAARAPAA